MAIVGGEKGCPRNGRVRIKENGNENDGDDQCGKAGDETAGTFQKESSCKKEEQGGEKSKFEVFPGALVGGEKEADDLVVPAPFVKKVGQGPRQGNEQKPCQTKEKDLFVHASNKCGRKGMYSGFLLFRAENVCIFLAFVGSENREKTCRSARFMVK